MGQPRGAKPKPTILKRLAGNPGRRKLNDKEPQPEIGIPSCPNYLSKEAKKEWRYITKELYKSGLLSYIDRTELVLYCQTYGDWVELCKATKDKGIAGMLHKTQSGNVVENPLDSRKNRKAEMLHKFLVEFGMTPSSRGRVKVESPKAKDQFEKFLEEGLTVVVK